MRRLEKKIIKKAPSERYFLALYPPLELRRRIAHVYTLYSKEARNFRFVEPEQMHVTVKFLGDDLKQHSLNEIVALIDRSVIQLTPPKLEITGIRFGFPHQVIPRILFFNIDSNRELAELSNTVHNKITALELADIVEQKDYKKSSYHLTIARAKHHSSRNYGRVMRKITKEIVLEPDLSFTADKLYLIKSKIQRDSSPKYQFLAEFSFKK